jgi:hypothetical protein
MASRFQTRRSQLAREQAEQHRLETERQVARLVELTRTMADRLEALPATSLSAAHDRKACVAALRTAAEAGARDLARRRAEAPWPTHGTAR